MDARPLILTLSLDDESQQKLDTLREQYFPPERNFLRAHCTLFHALPGVEEASVRIAIKAVVQEVAAFTLRVAPPKSIGRGVAFGLENPEAGKIHARLQKQWWEWLTPQDRQKLWPHVTVQNKVSSEVAKDTLRELARDFQPWTATATGLHLWEYLGGPWRSLEIFPFLGSPASSWPA